MTAGIFEYLLQEVTHAVSTAQTIWPYPFLSAFICVENSCLSASLQRAAEAPAEGQ
jgi:hypothetical protein